MPHGVPPVLSKQQVLCGIRQQTPLSSSLPRVRRVMEWGAKQRKNILVLFCVQRNNSLNKHLHKQTNTLHYRYKVSIFFFCFFGKRTGMTTLAFRFISQGNAGSGMHHGRFFHNQTIAVQTRNITTRIGQGNLINFVRVQPDLAFTAF